MLDLSWSLLSSGCMALKRVVLVRREEEEGLI